MHCSDWLFIVLIDLQSPSVLLYRVSSQGTDLSLSPSTQDLLAVPGAGDGGHPHAVCVVDDQQGPATLGGEHADLAVVPSYGKDAAESSPCSWFHKYSDVSMKRRYFPPSISPSLHLICVLLFKIASLSHRSLFKVERIYWI